MKKMNNRISLIFIIVFSLFIIANLLQPFEIFSYTDNYNKGQLSASETLKQYIELRLSDANWKEYSQYITWPDEPAWDCKWVVNKYEIGKSKKLGEKMIFPVVYTRLGLFCSGDIDFNLKSEKIIINYELVHNLNQWKINSEIFDYPEVSTDTIVKQLEASVGKATQKRRAEIAAIVNKIKKHKK